MYAALNTNKDNSLAADGRENVHFRLLVNTHGQVILTHDAPLKHIPIWIKYLKKSSQVEILFDHGGSLVIDTKINTALNSYLIKAQKVNVVRTEDKIPVENFETFLLNDEYN